MKAIHGLDGGLGTGWIVKTNKPKTLALIGGTVHKNFGRDNSSEGQECLYEFCIPKLLRQVIDEEVTAFGAFSLLLRQS